MAGDGKGARPARQIKGDGTEENCLALLIHSLCRFSSLHISYSKSIHRVFLFPILYVCGMMLCKCRCLDQRSAVMHQV